jgi:hypothetical protein
VTATSLLDSDRFFGYGAKETVIKNIAILVAAGALVLGAAGCKDDGTTADPPASPPASPSASGGSADPTPGPVTSSAPGPTMKPKRPRAAGSQIVMIDPDGKKYTRKTMIAMAARMAAVSGDGLPKDFCTRSYREGVRKGGRFPAGEGAFLEACRTGVRLAG